MNYYNQKARTRGGSGYAFIPLLIVVMLALASAGIELVDFIQTILAN